MSRRCPECGEAGGRAHRSGCSYAPDPSDRAAFVTANAAGIVGQLEGKVRRQAKALAQVNQQRESLKRNVAALRVCLRDSDNQTKLWLVRCRLAEARLREMTARLEAVLLQEGVDRHDAAERFAAVAHQRDSAAAEVKRLQGLVQSLADRVAGQSEVLSRRAERETVPQRSAFPPGPGEDSPP